MKNDQSTFIKELGYLIDQFDELQDLRWSDLQYLAEYRELKMKKNDGLPIDQVRLDQLEPAFKNKIVTASRWNKFQNALVGMQTFIKTEVEGFIIEKQIEITDYVDLKKVEVVTVVEDGKITINTTKDNALISIENKKDNIMDYMDGTTAGAIRNDIGVMGDSEVEGRSLIDKTNNLSNLVQQAFQSASDGKQVVATAITGKGVPTSSSDTFGKMATNINAITTDPSIGTTNAVASDLLATKKAISQGKLITGTIPSKGAQTYTPGITTLLIEAGQYLSGRQTIAGVAVPVANVLVGTTIAGQAGTMPNNGARNGTITTQGGSIAIPAGYTTGGTISASFANNIPSNIKAGVNIGGVVGNLEPVGETKSEMFAPTNGVKTYTSSLGKKPIMVCLAGNSSNVRFAPNFYYDFKINSGIAIGTSITVASGDLKATLTLTALSSNSAQVTVSDVGYASGSMTCWIYVIFA